MIKNQRNFYITILTIFFLLLPSLIIIESYKYKTDLTLNIKNNNNDQIKVFYSTGEQFNEYNSVVKEISVDGNFHDINFTVYTQEPLKSIRIDLGYNSSKVFINHFGVNNREINLPLSNFANYFNISESISKVDFINENLEINVKGSNAAIISNQNFYNDYLVKYSKKVFAFDYILNRYKTVIYIGLIIWIAVFIYLVTLFNNSLESRFLKLLFSKTYSSALLIVLIIFTYSIIFFKTHQLLLFADSIDGYLIAAKELSTEHVKQNRFGFRFLPSYFIGYFLKYLNIDRNDQNIMNSFYIYNTVLLMITYLTLDKILQYFRVKTLSRMFGLLLLFITPATRFLLQYPVTTDVSGLFLIVLSILFFINNNLKALFLTFVLSVFTHPLAVAFSLLFLIYKNKSETYNFKNKESMFFTGLILFLGHITFFIYHYVNSDANIMIYDFWPVIEQNYKSGFRVTTNMIATSLLVSYLASMVIAGNISGIFKPENWREWFIKINPELFKWLTTAIILLFVVLFISSGGLGIWRYIGSHSAFNLGNSYRHSLMFNNQFLYHGSLAFLFILLIKNSVAHIFKAGFPFIIITVASFIAFPFLSERQMVFFVYIYAIFTIITLDKLLGFKELLTFVFINVFITLAVPRYDYEDGKFLILPAVTIIFLLILNTERSLKPENDKL